MSASERGSALILMPTAVLVLLVLGAIAADAALVFMAQRELQASTAAAANDAAVAAMEEASLYECGALRIPPERARAVARAAFGARAADVVESVGAPKVTVRAGGDNRPGRVTVAARGRVDLLFAPAVSNLRRGEVTASSTATAELDPSAGGPGSPTC